MTKHKKHKNQGLKQTENFLISLTQNLRLVYSDQSLEPRIIARRYRQLFWTIIVFHLLGMLFYIDEWGEFLMAIGFLMVIILAIRTFPVSSKIRKVFRGLILGVFILNSLDLLIVHPIVSQYLNKSSTLVYILFLTLALLFLNRHFFCMKTVDQDILLAGISLYLLIGILWYLIYRMIYLYDPQAFTFPDRNVDTMTQLLYFSFTTLTTLGYGDITPASRLAMGMANIEGIIGQLYPAIFLARLVSLYGGGDAKSS